MESRIYSLVITSILAFALIAAAAGGGEIPTKAFENVLAQGEDSSLQDGNITGMPQDQISEGEATAFNPEEIIKKEARGLGDADLGEVQEVSGEFIVTQKGTIDKDVYLYP